MLNLAVIGGFGNMLSPAANHLNQVNAPARFQTVLDRGTATGSHAIRRAQWQAHGATLVPHLDLLITENLDGVVICAGKNGDDVEIIAKLVSLIDKASFKKRPFILHLSTVSCQFVEKAFAYSSAHSIEYVNYPLTGGITGAQQATMLILASGCKKTYEELFDTLSLLGKPNYFGERSTAGAEVKLMGHCLVFQGLLGMTNSLLLRAKCFKEKIGNESQIQFFDFLNMGAGGTKQWDVAIKPGVKDDVWDKGFLIKHAVIDVLYTTQLLLDKQIPSFLNSSFLQLALVFAYILKTSPEENLATQSIVKVLASDADQVSEFIHQKQSADSTIFLHNCLEALPASLQKSALLDVTLTDFERAV